MAIETDGERVYVVSCHGVWAWPVPKGSSVGAERRAFLRGVRIVAGVGLSVAAAAALCGFVLHTF